MRLLDSLKINYSIKEILITGFFLYLKKENEISVDSRNKMKLLINQNLKIVKKNLKEILSLSNQEN
jgi:hypothetical protein